MTLQEIADGINAQFRQYGLDHDVVEVSDPLDYPSQILFVDGPDPAAMENLLFTLTSLMAVWMEKYPRVGGFQQLRLF